MQQQKQQLPETEDWQVRLAKNMIQMDWKESDPVFVNLPLEEVLLFLFTQSQQDRHQQQQRRHLYLFGVLSPLLVAYWLLIKNQTFFILLPVLASVFLSLNYLAFPMAQSVRIHRIDKLIGQLLPQCRDAKLLVSLLRFRPQSIVAHRNLLDKALIRILIPMGGEAVFALPFELRTELAQLAEQRETPQDLSIVILLALTSARDGNVQPVLRRLSKDARSLHLREVAAECLREFSATP